VTSGGKLVLFRKADLATGTSRGGNSLTMSWRLITGPVLVPAVAQPSVGREHGPDLIPTG
jgi:hypothetical protein